MQSQISKPRYAITIVELIVALMIFAVLIGLVLTSIGRAKSTALKLQCSSNLRQIGLALSSYHISNGVFPFGAGADQQVSGQQPDRLYSVHSMLLPYLGHSSTYNSLNFSVAPFENDIDGTAGRQALVGSNATAARTRIRVYLCPGDPGAQAMDRVGIHPWGHTSMRSSNGSSWNSGLGDGMFGQVSSVTPADIQDGLAWTSSFGERLIGDDKPEAISSLRDLYFDGRNHGIEAQFLTWCRNLDVRSANLMSDSDSGQNWLRANPNWTRYNHANTPNGQSCKNRGLTRHGVILTASSLHDGGVNQLFADGSVRFIHEEIAAEIWRAIGSISGRENVDHSE